MSAVDSARMTPGCYEAFFHFTPFIRGNRVLEPGAGDGRLSSHLLKKGYADRATLVEIDRGDRSAWAKDISLEAQGARNLHTSDYITWQAPDEYDWAVMFPPEPLAADFAFHACHHVKLGGHVAVLQRLGWLGTQKRARWFTTYRYLRYVYVITWPVEFELPDGKLWRPDDDYAWFVFKPGWAGSPRIEWLLGKEE